MTLKIGIAGVRGLSMMLGFNSIPGVEVTALCDLHEGQLLERAAWLRIPNTYRIYEDMLDSDIDAVFVATPMQFHLQQTIQALEAGKHVLCEVTAGVTMDELWWLKEAVEKHGKVYMMAENYCYIPENQLIGNMVRQGMFGDIYYAEGEYLHSNRHLAFGHNRRVTNDPTANRTSWRHYWQYGKRGNFYPTHSLGPLMQWFRGDRIKSVACFGTGWHTAPQFRQEDTSVTMCQLESGKLIRLRLDCVSNRPGNCGYYTLQGTKGSYEAPRGLGDQHKIYFHTDGEEMDHAKWEPLAGHYDKMPERYRNATEEQKRAGHWGGDYFIVHDFIEAVRGRIPPAIDVYDACEWTAVGLLSELSIMNGGRVIDVPDFRNASSRRDQVIKL
ncbi:Gfo/Idh/MocA family protein [Paenibacillus oceani]|uniref:Gfo/Idh/MocA family oxidoreductase n=1 Tax=Paenibacillus oceani TaxID=2772510 RepID=A0A927CFI7_9BACL|nr:Gfo/Idh/MocA family oxidoreductase [Paenibacillus oceani]MBD2866625.1 Gfo/Idh/MocA family oxidoreductase [Paenibacillus oceani]